MRVDHNPHDVRCGKKNTSPKLICLLHAKISFRLKADHLDVVAQGREALNPIPDNSAPTDKKPFR